jgi:hypothetical protein
MKHTQRFQVAGSNIPLRLLPRKHRRREAPRVGSSIGWLKGTSLFVERIHHMGPDNESLRRSITLHFVGNGPLGLAWARSSVTNEHERIRFPSSYEGKGLDWAPSGDTFTVHNTDDINTANSNTVKNQKFVNEGRKQCQFGICIPYLSQ